MAQVYGRLLIVGKDTGSFVEFHIDKKSIMIGRGPKCDIRIVNKEISREHAELFVEGESVFVNSMGQEPISVNGHPITAPKELVTGDKIEVQLDGRTRVFYFQGEDETVAIKDRKPLVHANSPAKEAPVSAAKASRKSPAKKKMPPPPPPMPSKGAAAASSATAGGPAPAAKPQAALPFDLQEAIRAGIQLRRVAETIPEESEDGEVKAPSAAMQSGAPQQQGGAFVFNAAELMKLKAGLRKTINNEEEAEPEQQQKIDGQVAATAEALAPPSALRMSTAKKARKNVRFEAAAPSVLQFAGTPEGAANDATVTIRLRKGELEQIVNIDDNTFAFSEWALGTMNAENAEEEEEIPDTVISKKSRRASEAPSSVGRGSGSVAKSTPAKSLSMMDAMDAKMNGTIAEGEEGEEMEQEQVPAVVAEPPFSVAKGTTPAPKGTKAPATTPATAAPPQSAARAAVPAVAIDPASLATRLAELAQDNDVTFELPFDLFGATPFASSKKAIAITVTPKPTRPVVASSLKRSALQASAPRTRASTVVDPTENIAQQLQEAREQQQEEDDEVIEVTMEVPVMQVMEALQQVADVFEQQQQAEEKAKEEEAEEQPMQMEIPVGLEEEAEEDEEKSAQANDDGDVEMQQQPEEPEAEVPLPTVGRASAARPRRSLSRTPGTKIAIIARGTPATSRAQGLSSVKPSFNSRRSMASTAKTNSVPPSTRPMSRSALAMSTLGVVDAGEDACEQAEQGIVNSQPADKFMARGEEMVVDAVVEEREEEEEQAMEEEQAADQVAEAEVQEEDADETSNDEEDESNGSEEDQPKQPNPLSGVPIATYQRVVVTARAQRTRALQLATQLKAANARINKLRKAAAGLANALHDERAMRQELQNTLQQIVANREAAEAEQEDAERNNEQEVVMSEQNMDVDQQEEQPAIVEQRVIVVGYKPAPQLHTTEMAGQVVVVHPTATAVVSPSPVKQPVPGTARKTPARRASQLPRKISAKTPGSAAVVVDNVEVPEWVFDAAVGADASTELAVVETEKKQSEQEEASVVENTENNVKVAEKDAAVDAIAEADVIMEEIAVEAAATVAAPSTKKKAADTVAAEVEEEEDDDEEEEEDVCHVCGETDEGDILLLCDGCDNGCHLGCCKPVLKRVPKGDWFCVECVQKRKEAEKAAAAAAKPAARGRAAAKAEPLEEEAPKRGRKAAAPKAEEEAKPKGRGKAAAATKPAAAAAPKRGRAVAAASTAEEAPAGKRARGAAAEKEDLSTNTGARRTTRRR